MWLPADKHWRLNERHYGALQGRNKAEAVEKFGEAQVKEWRRGYATPPPPVDTGLAGLSRRRPALRRCAANADLPRGESLKDVLARVLPYWNECHRAAARARQARAHRRARQFAARADEASGEHQR